MCLRQKKKSNHNYQQDYTCGNPLNCLEPSAAHCALGSHPVGRTDQNRHSDSTHSEELTPWGKWKVMWACIDCFVRAQILQILRNGCHVRSPSSDRLTCQRPECEISSTARLTEIRRRARAGGGGIDRVGESDADSMSGTEGKEVLLQQKTG